MLASLFRPQRQNAGTALAASLSSTYKSWALRSLSSAVAVAMLSLTTSCGSQVTVTQLSSGQYTTLDEPAIAIRTALFPKPLQRAVEMKYPSTEKCVYREIVGSVLTGKQQNHQFTMRIAPVESYLAVTYDYDNGTRSAGLIRANGKLLKYNSQDEDPQFDRYNNLNYEQRSKEIVAQTRSNGPVNNPHVINKLSVELPEYIGLLRTPGEAVGHVTSEDGAVWAYLIYRGVTKYNGVEAAILDIERAASGPSSLTRTLVGFSIVNVRTAMPILIIFNSGTRVQVQLSGCS